MTRCSDTLLCVLSGLLSSARADSATPASLAHPYQGIAARNVFGLNPPAKPSDTPATPQPPPPNIILTGIKTILGDKRALMKSAAPAKPGQLPSEQSYLLGEGQQDGNLAVLEIDEKAGTVKVNNAGTLATLNFKNNGVNPGAPPAANPSGSLPLNLQGQMPAAAPATEAAQPQGGLPPRSVRAALARAQAAALQSSLTPEQQAALTPTLAPSGNLVPGTWRRSVRPPMAP